MAQASDFAINKVYDVLAATQAKFPNGNALAVSNGEGGWNFTTWTQYKDLVRQAAKACIATGLDAKRGGNIIGFNCLEWFIANLGIMVAGGVASGIYTTSSPEQVHYISDHSEAQIFFAENELHLKKVLEVKDRLPNLKTIVLMHGETDAEGVLSWSEFLAKGNDVSDEDLDARIEAQDVEDVTTLIYTSGTTGNPKAVMISQKNITWTMNALNSCIHYVETDRVVSYLPLSHIAAQVVDMHGPMLTGACTYFAQPDALKGSLVATLQSVRPTLFLGVPRVWEKIQAKMLAKGAQTKGLARSFATWAKAKGLEGGYNRQNGKGLPWGWSLASVVFKKVKAALGLDQVRMCFTAAAPISKATLEYFLSLDIPIYEVYGMSECTGPQTVSRPGLHKLGSCGTMMPGVEMKIADDGEICYRGNHIFKGYLKNEEATKNTIDEEGWLHSGDIGEIREGGFLYITDRKKELIITAGGENIPPALIEGKMRAVPAISQAVVVGDRQKFLVMLVTLDEAAFETEVAKAGSSIKTIAEANGDETFKKYLMDQINVINKELARAQTIKRIAILPEDFTAEGKDACLTPTQKLKRRIIYKRYLDNIVEVYGDDLAENPWIKK